MKCARIIKRQNVRNQYDERLIRDMMRSKVNDAEYDEHIVRTEFVKNNIEYGRLITRGSQVDREFRNMMRVEVENVWHDGKERNKEKTW